MLERCVDLEHEARSRDEGLGQGRAREGGPGLPGGQRLIRASGETDELGAIDGREVEPGDRLILETPGGGGYGKAIG